MTQQTDTLTTKLRDGVGRGEIDLDDACDAAAMIEAQARQIDTLKIEVVNKADYAATTSRAHESACKERDTNAQRIVELEDAALVQRGMLRLAHGERDALRAELDALRGQSLDAVSVAIVQLFEQHTADTARVFTVDDLQWLVDRTEKLRPKQVEDIYRSAFDALRGTPVAPAQPASTEGASRNEGDCSQCGGDCPEHCCQVYTSGFGGYGIGNPYHPAARPAQGLVHGKDQRIAPCGCHPDEACEQCCPVAPSAQCIHPERDTSKPAEAQGLFRKFNVTRTDGSDQPGGKHHGCEYFVLDVDHDQHAKAALQAYAASCAQSHPQLSADLIARHGVQPAPCQLCGTTSGQCNLQNANAADCNMVAQPAQDVNVEFVTALERIEAWDSHTSEYSADFGSNGLCDLYRGIARAALAKAAPVTKPTVTFEQWCKTNWEGGPSPNARDAYNNAMQQKGQS